jgi:hypothetical protein
MEVWLLNGTVSMNNTRSTENETLWLRQSAICSLIDFNVSENRSTRPC